MNKRRLAVIVYYFLYNILFYIILPGIILRLWWRSRRLHYKMHLAERLGYYSLTLKNPIWVHAVSVGESIAAIQLIQILQDLYPSIPFLVTTMTATGAARIRAVFGNTVHHVFIPYDLPGIVQRFIKSMQPRIAIIMETELWPNLLLYCARKNIPVCLINARLSQQSTNKYQKLAIFTREMLSHLTKIVAVGEQDAKRFLSLGATYEQLTVSGNMKFDLTHPTSLVQDYQHLRAMLGQDRFIWIAASTHEGEEDTILAAHQSLLKVNPNALLILVPRHPDRFEQVAKNCQLHLTVSRRSEANFSTLASIYLGDTMGELLLFYGVADVAFVGGSLIQHGGHNLLEPASLHKPILSGPHLFNFAEISQLLIMEQGLTLVHDANTLADQLIKLMQDKTACQEMGERAYSFLAKNKGALQKQIEVIQAVLNH